MNKLVYWFIAIVATALGVIGIFLPILPTTPFLILAAWAASKCSPKFEQWLLNHKTIGPLIKDWREKRAIPTYAKILAVTMMTLSWVLLYLKPVSNIALIGSGSFFTLVSIYILSRPSF